MAHVYFHIDLNAFFANAEVLRDPSLKGKPLVVSGQTRRSVVSTASYEARKYGIHSAMPIAEAEKLCRDLEIISGHFELYRSLSSQFMSIVRSYTPLVEQASIDECYADMTDVIGRYKYPLDLAWELQKRVLQETGLPCSIGVAPNLFLAKMASEMKKPMGITVLRIRDIQQKMWPLPISEMRGIGRKTVPYMKEIGIHTIGDLARWKNISELTPILGKNTEDMIKRANGLDYRELITDYDPKSIGVSETLLEDVTDYDEIRGLLRTLSRRLSERMKKEMKAAYRVSVRICYYDFRNTDRSVRLDYPVFRSEDIFLQAISLFDQFYDEGDSVRLLGISADDFAGSAAVSQMNLFDEAEDDITDVIEDLNRQMGIRSFVKASSLVKSDKYES